MNVSRALGVAVLALLASGVSAQTTPAGKWKATFLGPVGEQPKTFASAILDLAVVEKDKKITGTVEMGNWPGLCQISEGTIDGDHFSFVATGEHWSSSGYPRIKFDGTIEAGVMKLTMTWGYVGQSAPGRTLAMEAKRLPVSK